MLNAPPLFETTPLRAKSASDFALRNVFYFWFHGHAPQEAQPAQEGEPTKEGEEGNPEQAGIEERQHREGGGAFLCEALKGGLQNWQRRRSKPSKPRHVPGMGERVQKVAGRAGGEDANDGTE